MLNVGSDNLKVFLHLLLNMALACACAAAVFAQTNSNVVAESPPGNAYSVKDVAQRAVLTLKPEPKFTEEARKKGTEGEVVLRVVLSSSGKVTNIVVIKSLPDGLTEKAIKAARKIKFKPAMKDGHPVSQYATIVYNFSF
jgi:TonB family protein